MANYTRCKNRVESTIHVMGYGDLPDLRCAVTGGRCCNARRVQGKRPTVAQKRQGFHCGNFRPQAGQGQGRRE